MSKENVFRISVIEAGRALTQHIDVFPDITRTEAVRQLARGPLYSSSYDFGTALKIIENGGEHAFKLLGNHTLELRHSIFELARLIKPFWARTAIFGRQKVLRIINDDQRQCLRDAGLLDEPLSPDSQQWWEELAIAFRQYQDRERAEIGRRAELLTLEYERKRLSTLGIGEKPELIVAEDTSAGYDVKSYTRDKGAVHSFFIEVKGTTSTEPRFYISRNEWEACLRLHPYYAFYVWQLETVTLAVFNKDDLQPHVPSDNGDGVWMESRYQLRPLILHVAASHPALHM